MPKKSRRSRLKYKRRSNPQPLAAKEAGKSPQPLPALPRQAPPAKSPVAAEEAARHQYVLSDLRRTLITTAVILALLMVLYFILR